MTDLSPEQSVDNWNKVARQYAAHIDSTTAKYAADAVAQAKIGPDDRVLDVASGSGAATLIAARQAAEVVAADFSSEMCAALTERLAEEGVTNVSVHEMDAQALDLPDDGFDAAVSSFGVMICPDRAQAFSEMARVTKPGGRLVASSWQPVETNEWMEVFITTIATAMPEAPPPAPPRFMELADPERFRSELEAAGWSDVGIEGVTHTGDFADAPSAWAALAKSNPVFGPLLDQLPPALADKLQATFGQIIDERGSARLEASAWIASGTAT